MRYKLVGKTKFLLPVLVGNPDGTTSEHRFIKGKTMVVDESQINAHVTKFITCKQLGCVECPEEAVTERAKKAEVFVPKKRGRKPKAVEEKPAGPPVENNPVGVSAPEVDLEDETAE